MAEGDLSEVGDIVRNLGGFGLVPARTAGQLRELLRSGLPVASLSAMASAFGLEPAAITAVLRIPARTLARRKHQRRLSPEESDRLFRLSRVATLAEDVLGDRPRAASWLHAANRELGGATPLSRLDTDLGAEEVEATLLRLSHGVIG
ncbi:MAG TPA: antitoxin Xre/MbcA/ParS toxin-binding domain-containing protein [Thermoanaerobaculia bacterium]|nr:antitoxin Xre/MbcA/ParS toxin-binding domain-containing protein [Thermoanaerobaculia bacterium]